MIIKNHEETGWRMYAHNDNDFYTGNFYISCTTILDCVVHQKLKNYMRKNSEAKQLKVLKAAAQKGTDIHSLIQAYENQEMNMPVDDYDREQLSRWDALKAKHSINILKTELPVWHNLLWVAGTADYILSFDKKDANGNIKRLTGVGDLKTGRYDIKAGWQMAFYLEAYKRNTDFSANGMIGLSLPRDLENKPNTFVYEHIDSCWKAYLAAWQCFRMLYWNTLEKMKWQGLNTALESYPVDLDDMEKKLINL